MQQRGLRHQHWLWLVGCAPLELTGGVHCPTVQQYGYTHRFAASCAHRAAATSSAQQSSRGCCLCELCGPSPLPAAMLQPCRGVLPGHQGCSRGMTVGASAATAAAYCGFRWPYGGYVWQPCGSECHNHCRQHGTACPAGCLQHFCAGVSLQAKAIQAALMGASFQACSQPSPSGLHHSLPGH